MGEFIADFGKFLDATFDPTSKNAALQLLTAAQLAQVDWPDDATRDAFIRDVLSD